MPWRVCMWRGSEDNLKKSGPSFYHEGLRNQTQVIRFGDKHIYPMNHLNGPILTF